MDMASRQEDWTEETICSICLSFFTDPVILDCGHNFCRPCIAQYSEKKEINSCPECREDFPVGNLRVNRALANLAERARKLKLNPGEEASTLQCQEHQEELKLFCETDKKLICVICRDSREHREHHFLPMKEAVEIYKNQIKISLDSLTEKWWEVLEMERQQKQNISKIREQSIGLQSHITLVFAELHQILTEKEQCFLRDLREEEEKILEQMEENLCEIRENLNSIQEHLLKLEKQLKQKDGILFLKEESSWEMRISDDDSQLSLADDVLSTEKFSSPLHYSMWSDMLDVVNLDSVTLDVETANPRLEVSEDLKSLRLTQTWSSLPETWKRFTHCSCVLGSEGFTSGRHYWEVDVLGNRNWILGVAAKSVKRQEGVKLRPENGFWTIEQFGNQIIINASPESPVCAGQIPGKVGVYLSYESGTVSFYRKDTKSHLHTFPGNQFTEKLYPFFWTGHINKWLSICSGLDTDL
ncbi:zinc-binding protein A33-like [Scyliorhinus torazame]|uniref:zinc-binding protein A33-like n=1 Tax=Scyliorhinus torazame TaxID=75743 RepID=UPI003B5C34EF